MDKRMIVGAICTLILGANCMANSEKHLKNNDKRKPNLLFVFSDQQAYDMIGYSGNKQIRTPNLDKLSREGVSFSNAVSLCPICTPMRGMLMSGQHPLYNGCWTNDVPLLPENGTTFPQALNMAGYETAYIGKWHLYGGGTRDTGIPKGKNRHGFNGTFLTNNVTVDFRPESCFYWDDNGKKVFFKDVYKDHPWELEAQTRQAETWLENYDNDKPFALFVSWHPPHDYLGDGCPDIPGRQYNYNTSVLDSSLLDPYKGMDIVLRPDIDNTGKMADCIKEQYRNYMAMITACDASIGRFIKILKGKGLYSNTLIVFTSDHGDMLGSHGADKPKQEPQDYSCRVPLIMSGQNILPKNKKSELLIGTMDLMPTILGLLNIKVPESVQGMNLSPYILSGNDSAIESLPIFMFVGNGWRGVYTKEWTYAESVNPKVSKDRSVEINVLYNRQKDPGQLNNLYNDKNFAIVQKKLTGLTHDWMTRFGDKGFSNSDFSNIYDHEGWQKNYTDRPIDLLNKK
ncbi:MAG: sulfatase [Bacteroidetes bacterium]|nr:sulfatase [Bacteroidota bacterium]